jgi:hypothetical protein
VAFPGSPKTRPAEIHAFLLSVKPFGWQQNPIGLNETYGNEFCCSYVDATTNHHGETQVWCCKPRRFREFASVGETPPHQMLMLIRPTRISKGRELSVSTVGFVKKLGEYVQSRRHQRSPAIRNCDAVEKRRSGRSERGHYSGTPHFLQRGFRRG